MSVGWDADRISLGRNADLAGVLPQVDNCASLGEGCFARCTAGGDPCLGEHSPSRALGRVTGACIPSLCGGCFTLPRQPVGLCECQAKRRALLCS